MKQIKIGYNYWSVTWQHTLPYMVKINTSNLLGMNRKRFFLRINIFFCLYNDILNQNLNISKTAICHSRPAPPSPPPSPFLANQKVHISELSGQIFTNLPRMCENKFYGNKMKLKWRNYLKQKIYKAERRCEKSTTLSPGIMIGIHLKI